MILKYLHHTIIDVFNKICSHMIPRVHVREFEIGNVGNQWHYFESIGKRYQFNLQKINSNLYKS